MEIVAGELSCYRILAFISLKVELQMVSAVGKIRLNLPFFKKFTQEN
jgi:putative transposase